MAEYLLTEELEELLARRDWAGLRAVLQNWEAPEVAELLFALERPDRPMVFRLLPRELGAEVFAFLDGDQQTELLQDLTDEDTRRLLAALAPDDRTHLLEELPGQATQRLLNLLDPEDLQEARRLLGYPEKSVGRLMTPDYIAVRPTWTIAQALEHIRRWGQQSETFNVVYVTDDRWRLLDALDLHRFILADPEATVETIMDNEFVSVPAFEEREEAVRVLSRYDLYAVPVVDSDGVMVGIVTADDVIDVAEEEATEDFQRTAAVAPLRAPYRQARVWGLFYRRVGWLLVLAVVNLASSGVIAAYEEVLATTLALAFFIPLLIDNGGNAGAQVATLMVRALATGDVTARMWPRLLGKEVLVGLCLGSALAVAGYLLGLLRGGPMVGMVVGLTMFCIISAANLIGFALPLILMRLRLDPAVASSPLITSVVDATGLLIYFAIAALLLG